MPYLSADRTAVESGGLTTSVGEETRSRGTPIGSAGTLTVNYGTGSGGGFTGLSAGVYHVQYIDQRTTQLCGPGPGCSTAALAQGHTGSLGAEASLSVGFFDIHYGDNR